MSESEPVSAPPAPAAPTTTPAEAPAATEPADTAAVNTTPAAPAPWDDITEDAAAEEQANAAERAGDSPPFIGEKLPVDPDAGVIVTHADGVHHWYPDGTAGEARPMPGKPTDEQRAAWAAAEAEAAATPAPAQTTSQATTAPASDA